MTPAVATSQALVSPVGLPVFCRLLQGVSMCSALLRTRVAVLAVYLGGRKAVVRTPAPNEPKRVHSARADMMRASRACTPPGPRGPAMTPNGDSRLRANSRQPAQLGPPSCGPHSRGFRRFQGSCRGPSAMCARAFVAARRPLLHGDDATRARTSSRLARSQVSVYLCYAGGRLCAASRPRCCRSRLARSHVRPHANICGMLPWCPVRDRSSSWVLFRRCARCYLRSYLRPRAALCTREQAARC